MKHNMLSHMTILSYIILGCLLLVPLKGLAVNTPNWTINEHDFQYDMSIYLSLQKSGVVLERWNELDVAAFVGNECRGIATVQEVGTQGVKYYYLRVRSNVMTGEKITFKYYDKINGKIDVIIETVDFENLKQVGYPSASLALSVFVHVSGITLNKHMQTLIVPKIDTLIATILPADAYNKNLTWTSSDPTVASVTASGIVSALKPGTATITVKTEDNGLTDSCVMTIQQWFDVRVTYNAYGTLFRNDLTVPSGNISKVMKDSIQIFKIAPFKNFEIESVLFNNQNVTAQLTEADGEYVFKTPGITANSTFSVTFRQQTTIVLTVKSAENGTIGFVLEQNKKQTVVIIPTYGWEIYSVTLDGGGDVKNILINNSFTTPALTKNATLDIVFRFINSVKSPANDSPIQFQNSSGSLKVIGEISGETINVYNLNGILEKSVRATDHETTITLRPGQIYLVKIGNQAFKMAQ